MQENIISQCYTSFCSFLDSYNVVSVSVSLLAFCLLITVLLGFGFYLWVLRTSDNQTQSRLLNIFNGYLALACISFSLLVFTRIVSSEYNFVLSLSYRAGTANITALSAIFLLISLATILYHFRPSLYLEISLAWRHWVAVPLMLGSWILTEHLLHSSCEPSENTVTCELTRLRTFILLPATVTSFVCQAVVIIDDICGWRMLYNIAMSCFKPNSVTPMTDDGRVVISIVIPPSELTPYNPLLHHHAVK